MMDTTDGSLMEMEPFELFINAIRSSQTREKYQSRLQSFFDFILLPKTDLNERCRIFVANSQQNKNYPLTAAFKFILHQKERLRRNEIVVSTIHNYLKPIKLLCSMNDIHVNWKKVTTGLPRERRYAEDRSPTIEEIQKLIEYPDRRIKAIILTMASSGIRLGAWDDLKWRHIQPIETDKEGEVVAAKIIVYAGSEDQYFSLITAEAYLAIKEWMDFRIKSGEKVTEESWLMRNLWDVTTPSGGPRGMATVPIKLKHLGVKSLVERALRAQGIRTKLEEGKKRYPFQTDHGFRKYFKTRCEMGGMKSINIEGLMNHSTGVSDSYYRPQEKEIIEDYLKVTQNLTISKNNKNDGTEKQSEEERFKDLEKKILKDVENKIQRILLKVNVETLHNFE
jgi:integrase